MATDRRRTSLAARLLLLGVSTLIALLAAEGMARLSGRAPGVKPMALGDEQTVYRRSTNPLLGFELKPGYRNDDADYSMSYPFTNAHGQRDVERRLEKPAGVRRILLLGDSVVEGHGIRALDATISRQLEQIYADGSVEVLNFGVSGYCTLAEVELLETKGLAFDPDIVILVFVFNDFDNFNREVYRLASRRERPALAKRLFVNSHLFRLTAMRFDLFGLRADADPIAWNREAVGDNNVTEGLARLRRLADAHGFRPLIAVWPMFGDRHVYDVNAMPDDPGELVIERLARDQEIATFRLLPAFQEDLRTSDAPTHPRRDYTIGDGIHPSERGCAVAARGMRAAIARLDRGELDPTVIAGSAPARDSSGSVAARTLGDEIPTYAEMHNNAGVTLQQRGETAAAIIEFLEALRIAPEFAAAQINLGNALLQSGEVDEALIEYHRALLSKPDGVELHYNMGLAYEARGDSAEAVAEYRRVLELDPSSSSAKNGLERLAP